MATPAPNEPLHRPDRITPRMRREALVILATWTGIAFLLAWQQYVTLSAGDSPTTFGRVLLANGIQSGAWALITPAIVALARRFPIQRTTWMRAALVHLAAALVVAVVERWILRATLPWSSPFAGTFLLPFHLSYVRVLFTNLIFYAGILAITLAVDYARLMRDRELDAVRLAEQLSTAQLQALQAQMHPHFLFNTLHSASMLSLLDPPAAHRVLVQLSDLLRRTLGTSRRLEVPLHEELDFIERYLAIEQTRLGDRLTVSLDADEEVLNALVPSLLLQPLVENAVRHGIGRRPAGGTVRVTARLRDGRLALEIEDDGPGLTPQISRSDRSGMGLANVRERLERAYGVDHTMELAPSPMGGLLVRIRIPLRLAASSVRAVG
jgi:two-component system, LytTR family, sensor kinase